ncbi:MAG: hypothetical protein KDI11_03890 [Alphaproteobacteria bacterium]|nr:hypothetical protein [Alphaproteobacteria bacterium]
MKHSVLAFASIIAFTAPTAATADGFLDRIDNAVSKVENTIARTERTITRTENTAERLNDKISEAGAETPAQEQPSANTNSNTTAEEQRILDQARKIEEERVLREAEKIKARHTNTNGR